MKFKFKFHVYSLNYRDLLISEGHHPLKLKENLVPASDEADEITDIGDRVSLNFIRNHNGGQAVLVQGTLEVGGENTLKQSVDELVFGSLIHLIRFLRQGNGSNLSSSEFAMNVLMKNANVHEVLVDSVE
ncbi:unnamed protein product [Adineta ricciae]|uniref:Uncharacterized protein n=1 Tax=Adineta ricciae TaxID=249248 RepID=A0A815BR09_ADIRI|nr:unnamed protein product [Adineta ricciae]CAF1497417.1 unnamed protein product [Adineta ricciae]